MITIGINPVAFTLGIVEVRWYGIMVVLAVVAIIAISLLEARRLGVSEEHIYITDIAKIEKIAEIISNHRNDNLYIVDDLPAILANFKEKNPQITTFLINRDNKSLDTTSADYTKVRGRCNRFSDKGQGPRRYSVNPFSRSGRTYRPRWRNPLPGRCRTRRTVCPSRTASCRTRCGNPWSRSRFP